jgi:acyl-CoA reductase-like NAD-dependent aldehyde dehydrogenase
MENDIDAALISKSVASASSSDVIKAVASAEDIFKAGRWSRSSAFHRSHILSKIARSLERHISDLAKIETLQTGRTLREMTAQLGRLPEWL